MTSSIRQQILDLELYVPPEPEPNTIAHGRWRDERATVADKCRIETALGRALSPFQVQHDEGFLTLKRPLTITGSMADDLLHHLRDCPRTWKRLEQNMVAAKCVPSKYKGDLRDYFRGTPLIDLFNVTVSVPLPKEPRFAGTYIVGPSGSGKTTLLRFLALNDLGDPDWPCIIMMDSKATGQNLIDPFKTFRTIRDRLILIEPMPGLAINPLSIPGSSTESSIELMSFILTGLVEGMTLTALQQTLFRYALRALIESYDNPTIKDFQAVIEKGVPKEVELRPQLRSFFDNEFPTKTYSETRQQLQWRLRLLLDNPVVESMLSCKETRIDLEYEMEQGKIIIINANVETLSEIGAEFFQRFWVALILNAAKRRGDNPRPCYVYCDEFHSWGHSDPTLVSILDQARAARIGMILAHQRVSQLSGEVFDAVANCAVKMANVDNDAAFLAPRFRTAAENMRHPTGTFTAYIRDHGTYTITAPNYDLSKLERCTNEEWNEVVQRMLQYYSGTEPPQQVPEPPVTKERPGGLLALLRRNQTHSSPQEEQKDTEMKWSKDW